MELQCSVQNYAWGKRGSHSIIAELLESSDPEFTPKLDERYAELWMGTHPSGPATCKATNVKLAEYIATNGPAKILGEACVREFGDTEQLPYLFKVLSVDKALSIQVHPNKKQAEALHAARPNVYKDPNHKPELAVALTRFEALCGFRPIAEIQSYVKSIPELRACIGGDSGSSGSELEALLSSSDVDTQRQALRRCFASLMSHDKSCVAREQKKFLARLTGEDSESRRVLQAELFERLHEDYPGDIGCFVVYFLNYLVLEPGEAIYLRANEVHAYLSGDCVECMACSDNVVRAGLTPKLIDVETLVDVASFASAPADAKTFQPRAEEDDADEYSQVWRPDEPDFALAKISLPYNLEYSTRPRSSASILLVAQGCLEARVDGRDRFVSRGTSIFLAAGEVLTVKTNANEPVLIYQAFANVS
ncbi:unnamed protein product [Trichogramma brassicae]|uniref:mannose-6-phosphate isomerase n=1 Tax=Trichogramma brassicae TaxID=86971 RepID=A0A6H5IEC2_9HYME|nr:unnamed protein product [Trichogramma brassicae]